MTASTDKTAKLWDIETGKVLATFEHEGEVESAKFSLDGKKLITVSNNRTVKVWDVTPETRTPQEINEIVEKRLPFRLINGVLVPR